MRMPDFQTEIDNMYNLKLTRKYIKLKLIEDNVSFHGYRSERKHIYDLLKRVVVSGEAHSAMIIGPRGSGKSTLVNSVLHQLSDEVDLENDAVIVKLDGLVHTDDKLAIKSITAQMQLENAVGDRVFGNFGENLSFLLSCIQTGSDRRSKSMLFILEQCDMFCRSGRSQTLLYNLFDITHNKQAAMCVIGITNRLDIVESLEKRVKSRFSHRNVFIFPHSVDEDKDDEYKSPLNAFRDLMVKSLSMPITRKSDVEKTPNRNKKRAQKKAVESKSQTADVNEFVIPEVVLHRCNVDPEQFKLLDSSFVEDWNAHIMSLADDEKVVNSLQKLCYYTVNEQIFKDILFQVVCRISLSKPYIDPMDIVAAVDKSVMPEHRIKSLQSLSILELSLVIAMKHGLDIFDGQPMNFEMVLHRYTKFANANSSAQTVPRPVILKAFEHLQALELIMPVRSADSIYNASEITASSSRVQKEYQLYTLAVPVEDLQEAVKGFKALPTEISHWLTSSIV